MKLSPNKRLLNIKCSSMVKLENENFIFNAIIKKSWNVRVN